jgi:hypothetical protein
MSERWNFVCTTIDIEALIPHHWTGQQALLVCDALLALHDSIWERYRKDMLEALGEPSPAFHQDDDLPF